MLSLSWFASRSNVDDFTDKVRTLLADNKLRQQMGEAGREETLKWNWKAATSVLRNLQVSASQTPCANEIVVALARFRTPFRTPFHIHWHTLRHTPSYSPGTPADMHYHGAIARSTPVRNVFLRNVRGRRSSVSRGSSSSSAEIAARHSSQRTMPPACKGEHVFDHSERRPTCKRLNPRQRVALPRRLA